MCYVQILVFIISFIQNFQFYSIKKTPGPMIGLGNLDANLEGYFMYLFL